MFYLLESCNLEEVDNFFFKSLEKAKEFANKIIQRDIKQYQKRYPERKREWDIIVVDVPASRFSAYCKQREWCINIFDVKFQDEQCNRPESIEFSEKYS